MPGSTAWPVGPAARPRSQPQTAGAERLAQRWPQRPPCSGSLSGRAPFKLSLPLSSVGSCAGDGGSGGSPPLRNGLFPSFASAGVSPTVDTVGSTAALPEGSPRGCRDNHGRLRSTTGSTLLLAASRVASGRQALLLLASTLSTHSPSSRAGGSHPFRPGPLGRCCWCPPQGPSAPVPRFTHSCPRAASSFPQGSACLAPARDH